MEFEKIQQNTLEEMRAKNRPFSLEQLDAISYMYGKGHPNDPDAVLLHRCTQGELKARNSPNGDNFRFIANMCLVTIYQYWEDYFREEIGESRGIAKNEVISPIMGEIRYLRQAIIHNRGIATKNVEKCKILTWFKCGETIFLDGDKFETIFVEIKKYIKAESN